MFGVEIRAKGSTDAGSVVEIENSREASRAMIDYMDLGLEARILVLPRKRGSRRDLSLAVDISGWGWKQE